MKSMVLMKCNNLINEIQESIFLYKKGIISDIFREIISNEPEKISILIDEINNYILPKLYYIKETIEQNQKIKDGKIILKNTLFKIKELDINDCYYVVSNLLSGYGRVYLSEYWICIYSYKETKYFKYGFTNSKKHQRIQLIYTEENLNYIKNYIDKKYDSFENYIK